MDAGAEQMRFSDMVQELYTDPEFIPEDDEIVLLACRRITFDWVLHRHLETQTDVCYRDGVAIVGLVAETDTETGLPHVKGVQLRTANDTEETLEADLVVDASGRNTKLRTWLEQIGADALEQESESCGIFYCSRFYRLLDGVAPPAMEGPIGADLGYMKYAIFQGDSRIFSVTLAASPNDDALRQIRNADAFQTVALELPSTRRWVAPEVSEPVTDVYSYANLKNTLRFFVTEGRPLVLGLYPVGDALMHQNPISGRGCTAAFIGANLLADAFTAHPDAPLEFATMLHEGIEAALTPWYYNMRDQDRATLESQAIQESGNDPYAFQREDGTIDPKAYMRSVLREGLIPALAQDIVVLRAFMRVFNMLDDPADLLKRPDLMGRVLAVWQQRGEREPADLGPGRNELVERLESSAA
jgi:2-polyprenyl-6-methoxyphenol hydroxylase-like FAD-dependent oxidoreductase